MPKAQCTGMKKVFKDVVLQTSKFASTSIVWAFFLKKKSLYVLSCYVFFELSLLILNKIFLT